MIEIDGVRREFEGPITEAGDYVSDEFFHLLDLVTCPERVSERIKSKISRSVQKLNYNSATISTILVGSEVETQYASVVDQVNDMNEELGVEPKLDALITDDSRYNGYSGSFKYR